TYGREDLTELIVEFTGNRSQRGLLCGNELLCQLAALFGKHGEAGEKLAVGPDQIEAGDGDSNESCSEKQINLPLHPIVNLADGLCGLLFTLIILNQQARHGGAETGLPSL